MIAIVEAARAGLLRRGQWLPNIVAGLVVGVVALPLAMAFAIASGVKPEQGIVTAIIAGASVSLLGGTRIQVAGPTGAFVVILAGVTAEHGVAGLLLASLMGGVLLIALGALRLGAVIRFIPDPVVVGFTAGIAVIIFVGQWHDFFGLPAVRGATFPERIWALLRALPQLHPGTTAIAVLTLVVTLGTPRIPGLARVPGPLVAMLVATLVHAALHLQGVATIGSAFGGIAPGFPPLALPEVGLAHLVALLPSAFAIAMLGAIESLLSAVVADGMAGTRHDSNQELIGQGIANIIAPLFGGFAATGALARTATNFRNGATSPVAGVVHALTLLAVLLFLAPFAARIPLASLAAILFVVAWNMSGVRHFRRMLGTAPAADVAILLITFLLTVVTDLVVAVNVGVVLAVVQFLRRMASSVEVRRLESQHLGAELAAHGLGPLPPEVMVYAVEGPLFFGAVESLERALAETHTDPRCIVIRLGRVPFMDITGLQTLEAAIHGLERRGVRVVLCEANPRVLRKLTNIGLVGEGSVTPSRYHDGLGEALRACGGV